MPGQILISWKLSYGAVCALAFLSGLGFGLHAAEPVRDPGMRHGGPKSGEIMQNLTSTERSLARNGREAFLRITSVKGDEIVPESEIGLGPTFNLDSCGGCHAHPSPGG